MSRFSPEKKGQIKDTVFLVCLGLFVLAVLVLLLTGGFCVTHGAIHPRNADTLFVYQPEYETYTRIGGDVRYVIAVQDGQIRFYQEYSVSSLPLLRDWWEAELSYAYDLTAGTLVEEGGATLFPRPGTRRRKSWRPRRSMAAKPGTDQISGFPSARRPRASASIRGGSSISRGLPNGRKS